MAWFEKWKAGEIFLHEDPPGIVIPVLLTGEADAVDSFATVRLADGNPRIAADGRPVRINPKTAEFAETDSGLRKAMKEGSDLVALADTDLPERIRPLESQLATWGSHWSCDRSLLRVSGRAFQSAVLDSSEVKCEFSSMNLCAMARIKLSVLATQNKLLSRSIKQIVEP